MTPSGLPVSLLAIIAAGLLSATMLSMIRPLLSRFATAKPNARSSHQVPTPQGAGIAIVAATLLVSTTIIIFGRSTEMEVPMSAFGASLFISAVGFADDVRPIKILPRLIMQTAAVSLIIFTLPSELRIVPTLPIRMERTILILAGLWFVNLVNFMDGLDWMTVAEVVPITSTLVILGLLGEFPPTATIVAASLCGAMFGFAPFNRPVAKLFLGDVGSLPIGLLLGWCLLQLAYRHQIAAALTLPLYYLLDATATLLRRLIRGKPFWQAHRSHFYQRATDNGFTVLQIVASVFAINVLLAGLAVTSILTQSWATDAALFAFGVICVSFLLLRFSTRQ